MTPRGMTHRLASMRELGHPFQEKRNPSETSTSLKSIDVSLQLELLISHVEMHNQGRQAEIGPYVFRE